MKNRTFLIQVAALLTFSFWRFSLAAQDKPTVAGAEASPGIQQQIDALKEGQQRILTELEEIKKLLQERPARADYATKPATPKIISLNVHGEPFRGDDRARVMIMEYSDFDCSFCAKYVAEIYPLIDENYIKTGKIKYFFRDLPEPRNTNALFKAQAARCAGEHGKFWEMHDRLFALQPVPAGQDLVSLAAALDLDAKKFTSCLASERHAENIRRSIAGAERMGLHGTPAFLIGTASEDGDFVRAAKVFVGAESYEAFKAILDELLSDQLKEK